LVIPGDRRKVFGLGTFPDTLALHLNRATKNQTALLFQGKTELDGDSIFLGDGIRCCGGALTRLEVGLTDAEGALCSTIGISARSAAREDTIPNSGAAAPGSGDAAR